MEGLTRKRTRLDKKFDKIRMREESGQVHRGIASRSLRKMFNNKLAVAGLIFVTVTILAAIFAPLICKYTATEFDLGKILQPPSSDHILGTDKLGRDIFARILYGGRISILVGLGSALLAGVIGVFGGAYASYKGGWIDLIVLRLSEIVMAFPQIILVLLLVAMVGQGLSNLIIIFSLTGWGGIYRQTRAQVLTIREEEYIQALNAFGLNTATIIYKHILPNAIGPIFVNITLSTAAFILQEAALSFLGLGIPLNIPSWGNIINAAQDLQILRYNWWVWLPDAIMISLFVLSVNFIGDGLRDSTDPTQQG